MLTVIVMTTSLSCSAITLHTLIMDVIITILTMLLCPAVRSCVHYICIMYVCIFEDSTRIWNSNPFSGMVRLQGGNYVNQGRVEVFCNGQWGTICRDGFGTFDATTVCKQLGYSGYVLYNHMNMLAVISSVVITNILL